MESCKDTGVGSRLEANGGAERFIAIALGANGQQEGKKLGGRPIAQWDCT